MKFLDVTVSKTQELKHLRKTEFDPILARFQAIKPYMLGRLRVDREEYGKRVIGSVVALYSRIS